MTTLRRRQFPPFVLGIDQSYSGFAVCVLTNTGGHAIHYRAFPPDKSSGVDRLCDIGAWFTGVLDSFPSSPSHICMEGYSYASKQNREIAGELGGLVRLALRHHPRLASPVCYPTIVTPTQLKQFGCNSTKAQKSDVKMAVYKHWGQEFTNDNHADAYVLARIASAIAAMRLSPRSGAPAPLPWTDGATPTGYQRDVVMKLRPHTEMTEGRDDDSGTGSQRQQQPAV